MFSDLEERKRRLLVELADALKELKEAIEDSQPSNYPYNSVWKNRSENNKQ